VKNIQLFRESNFDIAEKSEWNGQIRRRGKDGQYWIVKFFTSDTKMAGRDGLSLPQKQIKRPGVSARPFEAF